MWAAIVVFPGMGRFDAAIASIESSWRRRPGSPGLSRYASWPGGPSKISVSMLDNARWKTESVVVIDSPMPMRPRVIVTRLHWEAVAIPADRACRGSSPTEQGPCCWLTLWRQAGGAEGDRRLHRRWAAEAAQFATPRTVHARARS